MVDVSQDALTLGLDKIASSLDRLVKKQKINSDQKQNILDKITTSLDASQVVGDAKIVVEAATENVDLKLKIFKSLSDHSHPNTILASNTSSISITKIASVVSRPE